jgi:hypothetical protein
MRIPGVPLKNSAQSREKVRHSYTLNAWCLQLAAGEKVVAIQLRYRPGTLQGQFAPDERQFSTTSDHDELRRTLLQAIVRNCGLLRKWDL